MALVKLDSFRKTLKEVKETWEEKVDEILKTHSDVRADDVLRTKLDEWIRTKGTDHVDQAHKKYKEHGDLWRRCAIHMSAIGFIFAFVQMSAGVLGVFLLTPALGWYASKVRIEKKMEKDVKALAQRTGELQDFLDSQQPKFRQDIIGSLTPNAPIAGPPAPPAPPA